DGFHSMASIVRTDREWDLAALLIWKPPGVQPVTISIAAPRPGDMLTIAGYGSGNYKMQSGPCTEYLAPAPGRPLEIVELAAAARHGDSGGPILNSRGELAGVLCGGWSGPTDWSYGWRPVIGRPCPRPASPRMRLLRQHWHKLAATDADRRALRNLRASSVKPVRPYLPREL